MNGLYKIIANNKNGFIVESLQDGKRTMVNVNQRIMTLSDISVYTKESEISLREVFKKISEMSGNKTEFDLKGDPKKLRDYLKKIVPDFDEERVYDSDIKKMLTWFDALKDKIDFTKDEPVDEGKSLVTNEHDRPTPKIHEMHGPKTENAKASTARTRKKV